MGKGCQSAYWTGAIVSWLVLSEPGRGVGFFIFWYTFLRILGRPHPHPCPWARDLLIRVLSPSLFQKVGWNDFFSPSKSSYHLQLPLALNSLSLPSTNPLWILANIVFMAPTDSGVWDHLACQHLSVPQWHGRLKFSKCSWNPLLGLKWGVGTPKPPLEREGNATRNIDFSKISFLTKCSLSSVLQPPLIWETFFFPPFFGWGHGEIISFVNSVFGLVWHARTTMHCWKLPF